MSSQSLWKQLWIPAVIVGALGYFVDIYDLVLFSIVRIPSLTDLGLSSDERLQVGMQLISLQMYGMLAGGFLWGYLGDRFGRVKVLFGSILLYSGANLANAFVHNIPTYGVLRFLAGVGLSGELGAAITLVSESLPKQIRGFGTTAVASFGILGAVLAATCGESFHWRIAYGIGGVLGLLLLILRIRLKDSMLFEKHRNEFKLSLFRSPSRLLRFFWCTLIGLPIWATIGVLVTFSPEISKELQIIGPEITGGRAILACYVGLCLGDLSSGLLSQKFKSRKKVTLFFLILTALCAGTYRMASGITSNQFYVLCGALGFGVGYWALFVTIAAEQFGTNLRSTSASVIPNLVRGSVGPLSLMVAYLKPSFGLLQSSFLVTLGTIVIAIFALSKLRETFYLDLDYLESDA